MEDSNPSLETASNPVRRTGSGAPQSECIKSPATGDTQADGLSPTAQRTRLAVAIGPALTRERRADEETPVLPEAMREGASLQGSEGVGGASVLDACCGSRMFWFDRADARAVFVDKRRETHELSDISSAGGSRSLVIDPDIVGDFTALPFEDGRFALVVFDPPHLVRNGKKGWLAKKYGKLEGDWREEIRLGFAECFRVLRAEGTLVFKWNEHEVPVSQVLALTPERPLFGNRCGRTAKSHWLVFMKGGPS